jgi:protein phosphatase 2C family protein 2/3
MDQKTKPFAAGNQRGRIILLGDGTEVLTDSDDTEMFDHQEEDKDLISQVHKGQVGQDGTAESRSSTSSTETNTSTEPEHKGGADGPASVNSKETKADEKDSESK